MMKKLTTILLALLLILSMTACGKNNNQSSSPAPANNSTAADKTEPAATDKPGTETTKAAGEAEWAMIPGTLNYINRKEGEIPVLKGLRLYGNRIGEGDDGSGKGITASVRNDGSCPGDALIQIYVSCDSPFAPVRPRLCGFRRISVQPGATEQVNITLDPLTATVYNDEGEPVTVQHYTLYVGLSQPDSESVRMSGTTPVAIKK